MSIAIWNTKPTVTVRLDTSCVSCVWNRLRVLPTWKKPKASTFVFRTKACACVTRSTTVAGDPIFFFSQMTINSALRPPKVFTEGICHNEELLWHINGSSYRTFFSLSPMYICIMHYRLQPNHPSTKQLRSYTKDPDKVCAAYTSMKH